MPRTLGYYFTLLIEITGTFWRKQTTNLPGYPNNYLVTLGKSIPKQSLRPLMFFYFPKQ